MPSMKEVERVAFLRMHLCDFLPENSFVRSLIQFNSIQSWDDLIKALQSSFAVPVKSLTHLGGTSSMFQSTSSQNHLASDSLDVNQVRTSRFTGK